MFTDIFGLEHWRFHQDCNSCENMAYMALGVGLYLVCTRLMRAFLVRKERKEGLV